MRLGDAPEHVDVGAAQDEDSGRRDLQHLSELIGIGGVDEPLARPLVGDLGGEVGGGPPAGLGGLPLDDERLEVVEPVGREEIPECLLVGAPRLRGKQVVGRRPGRMQRLQAADLGLDALQLVVARVISQRALVDLFRRRRGRRAEAERRHGCPAGASKPSVGAACAAGACSEHWRLRGRVPAAGACTDGLRGRGLVLRPRRRSEQHAGKQRSGSGSQRHPECASSAATRVSACSALG